MNILSHMSFCWKHFPTDKEHILLTPAVAFGRGGGEQEEVHIMTQWKRRFTDRSSKDTNNTRCTTRQGGEGATEVRQKKASRMWKPRAK